MVDVEILEGNTRLVRATIVGLPDEDPITPTDVTITRIRLGADAATLEVWELANNAVDHDAEEPGIYTKVLPFPDNGSWILGVEASGGDLGDATVYEEITVVVRNAQAKKP